MNRQRKIKRALHSLENRTFCFLGDIFENILVKLPVLIGIKAESRKLPAENLT